jgi:surface antigen
MQPRRARIRASVLLVALLTALLSALIPSPAHAAAGTNDYPYRTQTNTSAVDKWGFTQRQCVSFVAWRMAQAGRPISNAGSAWGHAHNWETVAAKKGKKVSTTPRVGALAHWNSKERSAYYPAGGGSGYLTAGYYGHVAYVWKVLSGGRVVVEHYNMSGNRSYSTMTVKAPRYLYL